MGFVCGWVDNWVVGWLIDWTGDSLGEGDPPPPFFFFPEPIRKKGMPVVSVAWRESELTDAASTCDAQTDMHHPPLCPRELAADAGPLPVQAARCQLQPRCVHAAALCSTSVLCRPLTSLCLSLCA